MRSKNIKKFKFILILAFLFTISNTLIVGTHIFPTTEADLFSYAQTDNLTKIKDPSFNVNYTALSLIPLMIEEMKNTNATSIPIKQVINATPSNITAIQSMSKNATLDNSTNNNFSSVNKTKGL